MEIVSRVDFSSAAYNVCIKSINIKSLTSKAFKINAVGKLLSEKIDK